jgi:hypothetical protein
MVEASALLLQKQLGGTAFSLRIIIRPASHIVVELNKNPIEGFSAGLVDDDNMYRWEVMIIGPPDTP